MVDKINADPDEEQENCEIYTVSKTEKETVKKVI